MENAGPRLIDEFRAEALARGIAIRGEVEECGMFGDLEWPPNGADTGEMWARCERDPAFTITGYSRWLAFARICGEIRYYAAVLPVGGMTLSGSGVDLARVAAADAESDDSELAILASVGDAVTLTVEYFDGKPLREIGVPRTRPSFAR
jgi:hypothetical protein